MTQVWKTVTVNQDDSIEAIAARNLGTAARWREIAVLNGLRYPFISAKPSDWFGQVQTIGTLAFAIDTGDALVAIVGERAELLPNGGIFFLDGYDPAGQYLYEALPIDAYNPGTGALALLEPFRYAWRVGSRWNAYAPQRDLDTRVARPGETIMLPIPYGDVGALLVENTDFTRLYGTDIELRPGVHGGTLVWEDGDLALVRGKDNIAQALRFRADLPFATNIFHPEEGNRTHELIGRPASPATMLRAKGYTRDAIGTDPRVTDISQVVASTPGDGSIALSLTVVLANNPNAVRVDAIIVSR